MSKQPVTIPAPPSAPAVAKYPLPDKQPASAVATYETGPDSPFPDCFIPVDLLSRNQTLYSAVAGLSAKTVTEIPGNDILGLINSAYSLGVSWHAQTGPQNADQPELPAALLDDRAIENAQTRLLELVDKFMQNGSDAAPVEAISNLLYDWLCSGTVDLKNRYNADQLYQATELIKFIVNLHQDNESLQTVKKGGVSNG